jgi:hypothetical protein
MSTQSDVEAPLDLTSGEQGDGEEGAARSRHRGEKATPYQRE